MKLISLDSIINKIEKFSERYPDVRFDKLIGIIAESPTIDPVEILDTEIKNCIENMDKNEPESWRYSYWNARKLALIDVLQKFNPSSHV